MDCSDGGRFASYRHAQALLSAFLALDGIPALGRTRQRTIRVGARPEKEAVTSAVGGGMCQRQSSCTPFFTRKKVRAAMTTASAAPNASKS